MEIGDGERRGGPLMSSKSPAGIKIYQGWRSLPLKLKLRSSLLKYLLRRKDYPLFSLNPSRGGLLKTYRIQKKAKMKKIVRLGGHFYHSLTLPRFPSKPYDRMVAKGGLNIAAAGTPWKGQVDVVILAVTRKCAYDCRHCYEKFNLSPEAGVSLGQWKRTVAELQDLGVGIITLSGGEPMLDFEAVVALLAGADKDLSEFHIHTSGHALTPEKAEALKEAGLSAVGVGLDDCDPRRHDSIRGYSGAFQEAVQAINILRKAGLMTYLNTCLTRDLVRPSRLEPFLDLARDLEVGIVRLLEPRPCGGYFGQSEEDLFTDVDRATVRNFFLKANSSSRFKNHPLVVYPAFFEAPENLGCLMAGLSQFHIDSLGNVEPCVFVPVTFGNIREESFSKIFVKMREAVPAPLRSRCPSLILADTIKAKHAQGIPLPIPYEEVREEWRKMGFLPHGKKYI
jgi:MoaA/NifB/PqqE/SkfB family radical SAM enzyme